MPKFIELIKILESQITHGDYHLRRFPADTELAIKNGVSHVTARKAIAHLVEKGLLHRDKNGRVAVGASPDQSRTLPLSIALLLPSYLSPTLDPYVDIWRKGLETAASSQNALLKIVLYSHWHDAAIDDAIEGFDGVFLIPMSLSIPPALGFRLRAAQARAVVLGRDLSFWGIQSVRISQPACIQRLLDHLASLGHKRIDCFNVMPKATSITERIEQWRIWLAAQGVSGEIHDEEGETPTNRSLAEGLSYAYKCMGKLLDAGKIKATAVYCTTSPAALGALRAMTERGIAVGKDISVCAATDEGMAEYVTPSLTSLRACDPAPYLTLCIQRIALQGKGWTGPLLFQPDDMPLYIGESTGQAPAMGLKESVQEIAI